MECPVCGRTVPADTLDCPGCGSDLTMSSLEELEQVARSLSKGEPMPERPKPKPEEAKPESKPVEQEKKPEPAKEEKKEGEGKHGFGRFFGKKKK